MKASRIGYLIIIVMLIASLITISMSLGSLMRPPHSELAEEAQKIREAQKAGELNKHAACNLERGMRARRLYTRYHSW